jgi:hypothetical protein
VQNTAQDGTGEDLRRSQETPQANLNLTPPDWYTDRLPTPEAAPRHKRTLQRLTLPHVSRLSELRAVR